ncbi:unnamed protein product [Meganyctiphanes norvegica]|uniref:BTB domain-containing protein n=1 Tax=Meganyctiphanes norvegica TaxID=48144 RepID=A0AAV2RCJ7_MEGNR
MPFKKSKSSCLSFESASKMPWQCNTKGSKERLRELFIKKHFADVKIKFEKHKKTFSAHRVILSMSSPVFEGIFFGPMGINKPVLVLSEESPVAFEIVLASCYEVKIIPKNIDVALEVYKLADKYLLDELKLDCSREIENLVNSENANKVLEFASRFNHNDLKSICFETLKSMFDNDPVEGSKLLLVLHSNWLIELLNMDLDISHLLFVDSWRCPESLLPSNVLQTILESDSCKTQGLIAFEGCISQEVFHKIPWGKAEEFNELELAFSLNNAQQAMKLLCSLEGYRFQLALHLQYKEISSDELMRLPPTIETPDLFISGIDDKDESIEWLLEVAMALMASQNGTWYGLYRAIKLPRCNLTPPGCKRLLSLLARHKIMYEELWICSQHLPQNCQADVRQWVTTNLSESPEIWLVETDEDIAGW